MELASIKTIGAGTQITASTNVENYKGKVKSKKLRYPKFITLTTEI